ncbi:MAG TPA: glycine betaine ABC transporter substrate-binding protein, partial [Candidatus Saccharimonadales bacterium]|nr:glycine betaine ABC transporter substrate-binding protein [Candidatus Saccharimonadales bacterium]
RNNLGGTEIVFQALRSGAIDVYPEYTGTILEVVLHSGRRLTLPEMREELSKQGLGVSEPLGFNDSYAIAVTREARDRYGLRTLSDLGRHPDLRLGLTHEFLGRPDGWPGLARAYGLTMRHVVGIQHELAYTALASGRIDATDIYTTDAQIERLGLTVLTDDRGFFPRYDAVWLYRLDLEPRALQVMATLAGKIDESRMIRANARVVLGGAAYQASADTLWREVSPKAASTPGSRSDMWSSIARNTAQHLKLVAFSLLLAILAGVPLGILAARTPLLGSSILSVSGLLQTIPSLALLAALIPLLGIGVLPALVALFLYSLLPIVRNTYVGLTTIPAPLAEAADAIGLTSRAQLFRVRLPMASPSIMAGIKTSAVINVGTATLAALIGAGGLGEPILSGIQLRQTSLILQGAIPAAVLALLVQRIFDGIDLLAVPKGLRLPPERI